MRPGEARAHGRMSKAERQEPSMSLFADIGARVNAQLQTLSGLLDGGPIGLQPMHGAEAAGSLTSRLAEVASDAQPQPPPAIAGLTILQDFEAFSLPAQESYAPASRGDITNDAGAIDPASLDPQPLPPRDGLLLLEPWTGDLSGLERLAIAPPNSLESGLDELSADPEHAAGRSEPPDPAGMGGADSFDAAEPVIEDAGLSF